MTRTGKLPGFGGGDKVKALLERGEWIIRKEAVQKLGDPVMQLVNAGQLPINRAFGGLVDESEISAAVARKKRERDAEIVGTMLNNISLYGWNGVGINMSAVLPNMSKVLAGAGRRDLMPYLAEGMKGLSARVWDVHSANPLVAKQAANAVDTAKLMFEAKKSALMEKIKSGKSTATAPALSPKFSIPQLPQAVTQFNQAAAPKAGSSLTQAAQKTVNVQFAMPGGDPVAGQFNESDIDKLFKTLKDAGLRSSGGHF